MSSGQVQRERVSAAQKAEAAAVQARRVLFQVEADATFADQVPSAVKALKGVKRLAEQATVERKIAAQDRSGTIEDACMSAATAQEAASKAEMILAVARHAATVSDVPFGEELSRGVARALRGGVSVREQPQDRIEVDGRHFYEGLALSFGSTGKTDSPPFADTYTSEDEISFSVDSCWVDYTDQLPAQYCATVALCQPGLHMGLNGLSPEELAADMCKSWPSELKWMHEEQFVSFLASSSERSLVLLLGSGRQGSITRRKMEGAVSRHDHYVPGSGLSGSTWHGDRAFAAEEEEVRDVRQPGRLQPGSDSKDALRSLSNSREACAALDRVVMDFEQQQRGEGLPKAYARNWLSQLVAQAGAIYESIARIDPTHMGLVRGPVEGLKGDVKRNLRQLVEYVGLLSAEFGLELSESPAKVEAIPRH